MYYRSDASIVRFAAASTKLTVLAAILLSGAAGSLFLSHKLSQVDTAQMFPGAPFIISSIGILEQIGTVLLICGALSLIIALIVRIIQSDATRIAQQVRKGVCCPTYGNPLHLRDGERLPVIRCKLSGFGEYELSISATTCTVENLGKLASFVSSTLNRGKYRRYAVIQTVADVACNEVRYRIEDVTIDKALYIHDASKLMLKGPTELAIQQGTFLDLRYSGSILAAGKTRSGKTTGIISLLIQVLLMGRDTFGSEIMIVDPKQAELSRLPHVYTLDENGEATLILDAVRKFAAEITERQRILNDRSQQCGDVVKWWDAGMKPSYLFLDEYVALRSLLPKKADKDRPDYCLATFDALVKRIVTMGASSGSFVIISIAEASVEEGGLPAMLRSAMGTKILFKPTLPEARLLWDSERLQDFQNSRIYGAGDAWFSSQDGVHDFPSYVHFPVMDFPVYRELGRLLSEYYKDNGNTARSA